MSYLEGIILDLDGVITQTARLHFLAWKETFDEYLRLREKRDKEPFREFTHEADYLAYVDGKPRYEGVRSFLESRGINLEFGSPLDSPDKETICGLGNKKNLRFNELLRRERPQVYSSTLKFIEEAKREGLKIGVASSSKNCRGILESCGLLDLFGAIVDGVLSEKLSLKGKPHPDIFITAARLLGLSPGSCIVIEDASSGVSAGRAGGFGLVIGVARKDNIKDLLEEGADLALTDLEGISLDFCKSWFRKAPLSLFDYWERKPSFLIDSEAKKIEIPSSLTLHPSYFKPVKDFLRGREILFFFDYDGTLTPIVERPDLAKLDKESRSFLRDFSKEFKVAIISGRQIEDVKSLVGIESIFYAGSHGLEISGGGVYYLHPQAEESISLISQLKPKVTQRLGSIEGVLIEDKKLSLAIHYRLLKQDSKLEEIKLFLRELLKENPSLRLMEGKKVFEIMPAIDWDKGRALQWITQVLSKEGFPNIVYIGDDITDEDAFRVVKTRGLPILVSDSSLKASSSYFYLESPQQVLSFLNLVLKDR